LLQKHTLALINLHDERRFPATCTLDGRCEWVIRPSWLTDREREVELSGHWLLKRRRTDPQTYSELARSAASLADLDFFFCAVYLLLNDVGGRVSEGATFDRHWQEQSKQVQEGLFYNVK